jgi:hypothetical protein
MILPPTCRVAIVALAAALVALFGCSQGPPTGRVKGKVTFKSKPVAEGRVTFINDIEGGGAEALLNSDGSYAVPHPVEVRDYKVMINPLTEVVDTDPGKTPPMAMEKKAPDIPRKYRQPGSTPLTAAVKKGDNELNFEMKP